MRCDAGGCLGPRRPAWKPGGHPGLGGAPELPNQPAVQLPYLSPSLPPETIVPLSPGPLASLWDYRQSLLVAQTRVPSPATCKRSHSPVLMVKPCSPFLLLASLPPESQGLSKVCLSSPCLKEPILSSWTCHLWRGRREQTLPSLPLWPLEIPDRWPGKG